MIKNYDDFFNIVWEEVSEGVVNDDLWYKHEEKFYEMTFEIYHIYSKTSILLPNGERHEAITTKVCARMIEAFIKNFKNSINC